MPNYPTYWITPADWSLDTSFDQWSGFNNQVERIYETANWYKALWWTARFTSWNWLFSYSANQIIPMMRIKKTNYLPDKDMNTGSNFDGVTSWLRKILIGWWYFYMVNFSNSYNWVNSKHITKLNETDLTVNTVNSWTWFSTSTFEAYLAWWKIFVSSASAFTYNWWTSSRLQVLNTDLTLDTTLTSFFAPSWQVLSIFEQADWKVVMSWAFTTIWWTTQNRIVRYNTDWTVDTTFTTNVWTWPSSWAIDIKQLSDWKLVLWWAFTTFNGTASQRVIILNTDWTISTAVASWFSSWQVNSVAIDWSDNIYCWWTFTSYAWNTRQRLAKLWSTLVIDATFSCDCSSTVNSVFINWTEIIVSWSFTTAKTISVWTIVAVDSTNWDVTNDCFWWFFDASWTTEITNSSNYWYIYNTVTWNIYGLLNSFWTKLVKDIVNIDSEWLFLNSFSRVASLWQINNYQRDWTDEYFSGWFTNYDWVSTRIIKFENWTLNKTFTYANEPNKILYDNWWLLVWWAFTSPTNRITKLLPDWTVDATFSVWTWFNNRCFDIIKLVNWLYLVVWSFTTYKWVACNNIITLDSVWTKDNTFIGGNFAWWFIWPRRMLQLSNGNILVYWSITSYKWVACNRAIILDSVWDQVAWLSSNFSGTPNRAVEYNGKVYFTGSFATFWATTVNNIACIDLATWTLVNIFWTGLNWTWNDIIVDNWGKLVVVWNFTTYNDNPVWYVARIFI